MCIGVESTSGSVVFSPSLLLPVAEFSLPNSWNVFSYIFCLVVRGLQRDTGNTD